jgi:hypothetical protein
MGDTAIAVIVRTGRGAPLRRITKRTIDRSVILDRKLDRTTEIAKPLELVNDLELKVYCNNPDDGCTAITLEEMSKKLLEYDFVVPY